MKRIKSTRIILTKRKKKYIFIKRKRPNIKNQNKLLINQRKLKMQKKVINQKNVKNHEKKKIITEN